MIGLGSDKNWHQGLDGPGLVGHCPNWGQEKVRLHARCLFILRKYVFPVKTMSNTGFSKKRVQVNQVTQNRDWHWTAIAIPAMFELLTNSCCTPKSLTLTYIVQGLEKATCNDKVSCSQSVVWYPPSPCSTTCSSICCTLWCWKDQREWN